MQTLKTVGIWLTFLLSLYILAPTILRLDETREQFKQAGQSLPWYYKILPEQEMNLGLDLRGGVYVEMEVDMNEAVEHQVNTLFGDFKRFVLRDSLENLAAQRVGTKNIRVEATEEQQVALEKSLIKIFGQNVFNKTTDAKELFFGINGDAEAARKHATEALNELFKNNENVPAAVLTANNQAIGVAFESPEQKTQITERFTTQPDMVKTFSPQSLTNVVYLEITETQFRQIEKEVIEQAAKSVRNRIDRFGVSEAAVSRQGSDRLVIELPGAKNPDQLIDIVKTTGKLEFRLVNTSLGGSKLNELVNKKTTELNLAKPYAEDSLKKLNAALKSELPEGTEILFSLDRNPATKEVTRFKPFLVEKQADVTGDMLENASVQSQNGLPNVSMSFNKVGAQKFGEVTSKNKGHPLAIVLDNVVSSAPNIQSAIMDGRAQISLGYGNYQNLFKEAQDLAMILKEGALPASLKVASKNVVGPSLGQDSIDAGLRSILISGGLVVFFMLLYYRYGGLIANAALFLNIIFIFAILCLMGASLTLPGMAGIVLTMGMAVDANVIIFERMREERKLHENVSAIIDGAYKSALSAIIDGNITTFIAGIFLFEYGTGPIKGFATTLMIGIVTTLFTAIIVTRVLYNWSVKRLKIKSVGF